MLYWALVFFNHCSDCRISRFWRGRLCRRRRCQDLVLYLPGHFRDSAGDGLRWPPASPDLTLGRRFSRGCLIGGEHARQLAERLLVALVRDLGKVSGEFQAHPFARADRAIAVLLETIEKIADRHAEHVGDLK